MMLAILFRPFAYTFVLLSFFTKLICLSNLLNLSVPDESYSRNVPCEINKIPTFSLKNRVFSIMCDLKLTPTDKHDFLTCV